MSDQATFSFFQPPGANSAVRSTPPARAAYIAECRQRWGGEALRDALRNWKDWLHLHGDLLEAMRTFHRNPWLKDVSGKCHNPDGTLTAFLWKLQAAWETDRSCLAPLMDFEEHFQKVFLRRGLIIYCKLLLRQIEGKAAAPAQPEH